MLLLFAVVFVCWTAGSLVRRLEMRLLLWDGGYFPISLKFCVIGGIRTEGSEFPSHFQVRAGSRQLLYSLQRARQKEEKEVISHSSITITINTSDITPSTTSEPKTITDHLMSQNCNLFIWSSLKQWGKIIRSSVTIPERNSGERDKRFFGLVLLHNKWTDVTFL